MSIFRHTLFVGAVVLGAALPLSAQWSSNGSYVFLDPSNESKNVVLGPAAAGSSLAKLTISGAEPFRFALNPFVRVLDLDYNQLMNATQSRNGAALRVDLRWGDPAPNNFTFLPAFSWLIRNVNEALPDNTETTKMYLDHTGTLGIGYRDKVGGGLGASQKLVVNGTVAFGYAPESYESIRNNTDKLLVNGNITSTGIISGANVRAMYQDLAEWVPAADAIADGSVVVLDPERANHVVASSKAYDETVAGVVSPRPGIVLGEEGTSKVKVATTGRVKVKVDATRAPIRIGDLLVTGDKPGTAMRSERIDVGGVRIHRPGTVIGKALEPLASGEGEILVLLSMQ